MFAIASLRRRLASLLYDALLLFALLFIGFLLPHMLLGVLANVHLDGSLLWAHVVCVAAAYFLWFWLRAGQTLPMRTWKIRLVKADGYGSRLIEPWRLVLRFALAWPSLLLFGCGVFWALFDSERQFLHDRLAGTRIIFTGQTGGA